MEPKTTNRFVRISEARKEEVYFSKSTLYKWHSKRLYPGLFRKLKGSVFIDLHAMEELLEKGDE